MPLKSTPAIRRIQQDTFHQIDREVMRHAFDIHNKLGRFCDELIYRNAMSDRCEKSGLEVQREVPLLATFRDFTKSYYIDLLIESGALYELKACHRFSPNHQKQAIHYLILAGLHHGKLINFHPESVEYRFVSTQVDLSNRAPLQLNLDNWNGFDRPSQAFLDVVSYIIRHWGTFLDISLYMEAAFHFLSPQGTRIAPVEIEFEGTRLGTQEMPLLDDETTWRITSFQRPTSHQRHFRRLLTHTGLRRVHWVNIQSNIVAFETIERQNLH